MTAEQFTYWLQGYSEVCGDTPTDAQWEIIQDHLRLVFQKETATYLPDKSYCAKSPSCGPTPETHNICGLDEQDLQTINQRLKGWGL